VSAPDEEEESDDDDDHYQVRRLGQDEDLVIDGETAVDDLLVAQRIAQQEAILAQAALEDREAAAERKVAPSQKDVDKLLRLLRQTNKLTAKIGELPSQFSSVVGEEVRNACRAAASAMDTLPIPKVEPEQDDESSVAEDEDLGNEAWGDGDGDPNALLAAVDLHSTSESEVEDKVGQDKVVPGAGSRPAAESASTAAGPRGPAAEAAEAPAAGRRARMLRPRVQPTDLRTSRGWRLQNPTTTRP